MNWKKEGYKIGQKVCVILSFDSIYSKKDSYNAYEAEITYVGTKKIKAKFVRHDETKTIEFKERFKNGPFWGSYYSIWDNEQGYKDYKTEQYEIKQCQNTIKNKISLIRDKNTLDKIKELMDLQLQEEKRQL